MPTTNTGNILIIDDDPDILQAATLYLKQHFEQIDVETNPNIIPKHLESTNYDAVLLDMNFTEDVNSGKEGYRWLQKILDIDASVAVVLITAYGNVDKAVKAIKMGAADFVMKPWQNEKLLATVSAAISLTHSRREAQSLRSRQQQLNIQTNQHYQKMVGQSTGMTRIFEMIEKVAHTPANVLITGENGTGKELVARALHHRSGRRNEAFIHVDIGSISESLFESELFGHAKGAFTDAKEAKPGRFEIANGGTLFLDEIGNVPLSLQAKLLSAIETRKTTRIGSNQSTEIDIRLICATNEPLKELKNENRFRQDLLYRINTIHIEIPPLRRRTEDILLLTRHFIQQFGQKYGKQIKAVSESAMAELKAYAWPGNVRELRHAVERAVIMTDSSVLEPDDLLIKHSGEMGTSPKTDNLNLEEVESVVIQKALDKYEGNISKAADELGLSRAALYRRIEKYKL